MIRSKTDQEGKGFLRGVTRHRELCPVTALEKWLDGAAIASGPIFRPTDKGGRVGTGRLTDRSVASLVRRAVKRAAIAAGLSSAEAEPKLRKWRATVYAQTLQHPLRRPK